MAEIQSKDILNEKTFEIILNFKPSEKHEKAVINEILRLKDDIKKAIALLPKSEQEILDLRFFKNLSDEKIAERISKPRDEVNKILFRGVKTLKEKLEQGNLSLENVQKAIEIPPIKHELKQQSEKKNQTRQVVSKQVSEGTQIIRRPTFLTVVFSLIFYAVFFGGCYFVAQKFFFHTLPTLSQIVSNVSHSVPTVENRKPISGKNRFSKLNDQNTIKISGSSSLFELAKRLDDSFNSDYPEYHFDLISSDSDKGIQGLLDGKFDIANSSRPIAYFDRKKASEHGLELTEDRVALDALIIVANKRNPVNEISLDDLEKIFTNELKSWKEVDSSSFEKLIIPVIREEGSGTNEFVVNRILEGNDFPSSIISKGSNVELIKFVAEYEGAVSFINSINYPWGNKDIKYLKVKNYDNSPAVSPFEKQKLNESAIRYGDYPLARYLYLVTLTDAPKKVQDFVSWVLDKNGQKVVASSGLLPILKNEE